MIIRNRILLAAVTAALLFLAGAARAISVVVPDDPTCAPLELKSQIIDARIDGPVARTKISQVFHNRYSRDLEGSFLLTLPKDAQVTDFVMTINGKEVHAETLKADEARRIYTDIVRRAIDPGLLEFVDGQTFRVRVYPIPARGDLPIEVHFAQPLRREGGLLAYDMAAARSKSTVAVDESELTVSIHGERPEVIYSPTHAVDIKDAGRDVTRVSTDGFEPGSGAGFTLLFSDAASKDAGEIGLHLVTHRQRGADEGTFLLMVHPPAEGALAKPLAKTVTFVIDVSGSMSESGKLEKARPALVQCLAGLGNEDSFNLLSFSTNVDSFAASPVPATEENIAAAREWINALRPKGGTNIDGALRRALETVGADAGLHQIVFVTDGQATVGVTDSEQILRSVKKANARDTRVFALGVGTDVNTHLLDRLGASTRALSDYIGANEDIETRVASFFDAVAFPVLSSPELAVRGVEIIDTYPVELPDLFRGRDLVVFGRYRGDGNATLTLSGRVGDAPHVREVKVDFPKATDEGADYVAALWANRKVAYLLDQIRLNGADPELVDEVTALAEEYNLVTPYTSYLVADDKDFRNLPGMIISNRMNSADVDAEAQAQSLAPGAPSTANAFRADSAPAMMSMPAEKSGEEAVRAARALNKGKQAQSLSESAGVRAEREPGQGGATKRRIGGDAFAWQDGAWVEQGALPEKVVKVKYLGDAWMALLERFPAKRKALELGERVTLKIAGCRVEIGPDGIEKAADLPEELAGK